MPHARPGSRRQLARRSLGRGLAAALGLAAAASCQTTEVELLGERLPSEAVGRLEPAEAAPALDVPAAAGPGCPSVDFLFVVDNSRSMQQEQASLARSFPGFIEVVRERLRTADHHVMVVDTDASGGAAGLTDIAGLLGGGIGCRPAPACCRLACGIGGLPVVGALVESCNAASCEAVRSAPAPDACEGVLGAGKRLDPDGRDCGVLGSARYMSHEQPALADAFSCVAQVGTFGDGDEQPMAALLAALGPEQNGPEGCNAGFSRGDAVLVVTIISDEDDESSPGDVAAWRDALLRAKADNPAAIVVLGLLGDDDAPGGPASCAGAASPAPRLRELVQSFRFGSIGSICADDYTPFFERAVSVIDDACTELRFIR